MMRHLTSSLLLATALAFQAPAKPAPPEGLLVNGVSDPLAIDRDATRFTWRSAETSRGATQTAYQILVASNIERLAAGTSDWWDSRKVDSTESASVEYAGKPLPPATRFWWKVRTWDQIGKPSPFSAPASFDTGLSQPDWTARYIWDGTTNVNNFAYFRKTFAVPRKPDLAKVYVTAHNDYLLFFNGQILGRGPARCDPYHNGQYNAYDITGLVKPGSNVFAAMGHWQGTWNDSGIDARPAFRLEARLDYSDVSPFRLATDESWKVLADTAFIESNAAYFPIIVRKPGPDGAPPVPPKHRTNPPNMWTIPEETSAQPPEFVEPDWGNGGASNRAAIQFDSRGEPVDWRKAGFDDSGWASATVVARAGYHLFAQMAPAETEHAELKPVSVTFTNGAWLVDFGWCLDGWPKLTLHANRPGDLVRVEYFQMSGERKPAGWDQYTCHGGPETWKSDFGRHASFQELKIIGYGGKLKASDVRAIWAYCDADVAGGFRCSSPLLNDIYEMCERSARQNVQQAIISVDANREQSPWTADSWNIGNVLLYNHRDTMMIDKVVRDYGRAQLPNGDFPACCPAQRSARIPEWSMYWPMLLWEQYLFSGDRTLLREMAPRLTHFLDWLRSYQDPATRLLNPPLWRISDYAGGNLPNGGYNIATACQYYENLRIASQVYSVLGQTNQGDAYARQAEAVKAGINAHLFNGEYYLARTDRKEMFPLASAWALRFDLLPPAARAKVLATILAPGTPNIGGYGGDAFYSGVLNAGGGDFVVRDLARYRPMLEGNKANWETFHLGNDEVNHAWTAYPGYLFLKYISGIQPTSGGFATFDVRPETGGLTFAEGTVPTVKGLITTRWEQSADGRFALWVNVPPNTCASIYIPKPSKGNFTITESGKPLWPAKSEVEDPGVLAVSEEAASIKCLAGAGAYRFSKVP
ncbi:MAG TPA: alpha-L-rhamnosidase N-terminal domain-containing protein [Candidatus Binatia bacterium]|jgi:alpha-L-rhamnosidase|nr:alpha-L-rhamnosidase N-terminal domain-containing protein [Candidatus Binatia bacterium]